MFFAICLIYMPRLDTVTYKMVLAGSFSILASGLLPGNGYMAIFFLLNYTLFFAVVICLSVDIKSRFSSMSQESFRQVH